MKEKLQAPDKPVFRSAAAFRKRREAYLAYCAEKKRIPNPAGFCAFAGITRAAFARLAIAFPLQYDLTCSAFLDEALNTKCANSGAVMQFLTGMTADRADPRDEPFRLVCEGGLEDGE